ncbi:unnamed protein product [Coregonus sp. 'balchen']|nr:unnamed protein product [Coregonus sp. 'balchen']
MGKWEVKHWRFTKRSSSQCSCTLAPLGTDGESILETIWDKHSVTAATPPPSPTSGESAELLGSLLQGTQYSKLLSQPIPALDNDSEQLCSLALECLAHLFSWIPLSTSITPSLLASIFHFARFGCDLRVKPKAPSIYSSSSSNGEHAPPTNGGGRPGHQTGGGSGGQADRSRLGVLAMTCINELVSKNCVPLDFEEYLLRMFQQTFFLLQRLTRENNAHTKFTDFLRLFVSVHLRRIESNAQFPVVEFLALLFKYKDALVLLLREVLNRIQFRYNQAQLEELDDETLDDDQQTDWQRYLRQSLEVVAKVMELLPSHAFATLFPVLQEDLDVYLGRRLNITAEHDCRRLHCALRDLSSLLQAVGRLAGYFIGDVFAARFNDALAVVERLVEVTCYGSQISLHAQSLAALQAYSHWLAQFYSEVQRQNQSRFISLVTSTMDATAPLITAKVPEKLLLSACHLMVSMATTVRPVFLVTLPAVQNIFNLITESQTRRLPQEAHMLVCRALSNMLLLPWSNLPESEQQWQTRSSSHGSLLAALTRHYRLLRDTANQPPRRLGLEDTKAVLHQTLPVLRDIVDSISGESTKSRQICYQSLQESVQVSLGLFPVFIQQLDVTDEMLSFFLTLFQGLRVQMGVPFTGQIIHTFLSMFTSAGCRVVEKFLKILQVVVQEPGQAFKPFLPSVLSLCMEQVYPIVAERSSPDVKAEMFELLYQVLHHNWRYFFKTSVLASVQRGSPEEAMENEAQFSAAMQAFGQSFLQPDIHIFKQNLSYLESLNSKHKLYHRKLFRTSMLFHFINVLLQVLLHKSHDLLQEEMGLAVYNMASVDFDAFYSAFMPEFLNGCQGVDANQRAVLGRNFKLERDLPSFTQSVHRLVNDLRYYRLCNSSLPTGTVKL